MKIKYFLISVLSLFILPIQIAFAVTLCNPLSPSCGPGPGINEILNKILDAILLIGTPIATIMIIYGAFQMLFSGGNTEKFQTGQKTLLYTAIGYGIILISKGISIIISNLLG